MSVERVMINEDRCQEIDELVLLGSSDDVSCEEFVAWVHERAKESDHLGWSALAEFCDTHMRPLDEQVKWLKAGGQQLSVENERLVSRAMRLLVAVDGFEGFDEDEVGQFLWDEDGEKLYRATKFPSWVLDEAEERLIAGGYGVH